MIHHNNGSRPFADAPAEWFTGRVRIDPFHQQTEEPSHVTARLVTSQRLSLDLKL